MPQAVILAGGKGTRLRERLNGRPKPLIDICGVPLLERQILLCKKFGYDRIIVLVNHAAEQIVDFCSANENWGIDIECVDDGEPRGTAGAVFAVLDRLEDDFLVIYGDTMLSVDLARFEAFHRTRSADVTLFLHPNDHPQDSDLVSVDEQGNILAFHPYPHPDVAYLPNLVNAALYVVRKRALEPFASLSGMKDFAKDIFPLMLANGFRLVGYNSPEYIKDVGTPSRLDKVCEHWRSGRIEASALDVPQPVVFLDRDGVINEDPGWLSSAEQFNLLPGVGQAIRALNASSYRTVVVTNQPVIARGECSLLELRRIHNKMDTLLGREGAYLDRLYYCPHHPDRGFDGEVPELKIACQCRKPGIGMLEQARQDINADFSKSWVVGDSASDVLMARTAGITSILIETTPQNLRAALSACPDFVQPDLCSAVAFILDEYPRLAKCAAEIADGLVDGDLVAIGGLAHSGKTTLAAALRLELARRGRGAVGLSLDRWIHSEKARGEGVTGRYDMPAIKKVIELLRERTGDLRLSLPEYDPFRRERSEGAAELTIQKNDVVILDGVVALLATRHINAKRIFVRTEESTRLARFTHKYKLRGASEADATALYESRKTDEEPIIAASESLACRTVSLPLGGS